MPKIFVGSSSETLPLANTVLTHLHTVAEVTLWNDNVFDQGKGTLETLVEAPDKYDFAVFILGPDDGLQQRGTTGTTPRGNVLFELGLFMGSLGRSRVFAMFSDQADLVPLSDLKGVTVTRYVSANLVLSDPDSCVAATKSACDTIRVAMSRYKPTPPPRSDILTDRAARSISNYLGFKQEDIKIAVDKDDSKAIAEFDHDCHAVMSGSRIYDSIKDALGTQFGFYVQAIGAVGEKPEDLRYLNCCLRPGVKHGGRTYLDALLLTDQNRQPKSDFIESNIIAVLRKKSFGHWLLSTNLDPVPLAVAVDLSQKSDWRAKIIATHKWPLVFTIDVSETSDDFKPATRELTEGAIKVAFEGLDDRFKSLKGMLSDHEENYMGKTIKSVLFVPIHGWPGITLQILTRERLTIDAETALPSSSAAKAGEQPIRLTVDELMSIRLCGERLQGLLAHQVRPMR